jgi:hypothetical protein
MRAALASIPRMVLMAAIVATMLCWPVGIVVLSLLGLFGVPIEAAMTFGGTLNRYSGLLAWWLVGFVPALAYTACVFPWSETKA